MWQAILWLTVIGLFQIVTFFVMVLLIRLAIRDRKRDLAAEAQSDTIPATPGPRAPEEPQLVGSHRT
jgi:hypothetical protein